MRGISSTVLVWNFLMKLFLSLLSLLLSSLAFAGAGFPSPPPKVDAKAALLFDVSSGQVLAAQNAERKLEPASLTKLMVAYLAFEALKKGDLDLDDTLTVSQHAAMASGSRMFAKAGQTIKVDDLLSALIIQSANDAALTLAEEMGGSEAGFVEKMNAKAKKLGLASTHFTNATGHSQPGHLSTAQDMTRLAVLLMAHFKEPYKRYFSRREFSYGGITQQNRNLLLWRDPMVDGVKTGHTQSAGYCQIASAERNGRRLVATILGARSEADRAMYALQWLNYGFLETESIRYYKAGKPVAVFPIYKGSRDEIRVGFLKDFSLTYRKGVSGRIKAQVISRQPYLAPIRRGQAVATLRMTLDGNVIGDYPLVALEDVAVAGWFGRFWDGLKLMWK